MEFLSGVVFNLMILYVINIECFFILVDNGWFEFCFVFGYGLIKGRIWNGELNLFIVNYQVM